MREGERGGERSGREGVIIDDLDAEDVERGGEEERRERKAAEEEESVVTEGESHASREREREKVR